MKHLFIMLTAFLISATSYAQFQISFNSGYALGSAEMKLGETINVDETENAYGSYGEGFNFQLRGTYFFNDSFGVDIGLGYLHGTDQTASKVSLPNNETDAIARARAFGASASVVYKFTNNIYGRFGALIKVGGKTEAVVYKKSVFSQEEANAFHGQFPLGFAAALGYKYELNSNFSIFVEAEYYGISLKRKDSEISQFNTDIVLPDGNVAVSGFYTLDNLPAGYVKKTTYVDNLSNTNTDPSKKLAQKVPYSSFGINFGITYHFKCSAKKNNSMTTEDL